MKNINSEMIELIDSYLAGRMPLKEKETFEKKLIYDSSFYTKVEEQRQIQGLIRLKARDEEINSIVADIHRNYFMKNNRVVFKKNFNKISTIAASIAFVLIGVGLFETTTSDLSAIADGLRPYEARSLRSSGVVSTLEEEMNAIYLENDFRESINFFKENKSLSDNPKALFLVGNSYLELGDNTRAIDSFEKAIYINKRNASTAFLDKSEWYLAHAYLKENEIEKAKKLFKKIKSDPQHFYYDKVSTYMMLQLKLLSARD